MISDKTAVVTGGASGIGREIALTFAEYGANIVVADIQKQPRNGETPTHRKIRNNANTDAKFVECDVRNTDEIRKAVDGADEYGGIDVMVNNAAIGVKEEFLEMSEEEYERIMEINTKGVFFGSQIAAKRMIRTGSGGSIINMSSIAGIRGTGAMPVYSASKGAVRLLTYALADSLGPEDIRINALHPGTIQTAMSEDIGVAGSEKSEEFRRQTPMNRLGTPKDVANAAVFLASDLSAFLTGASIPVDGGRTYTY